METISIHLIVSSRRSNGAIAQVGGEAFSLLFGTEPSYQGKRVVNRNVSLLRLIGTGEY